MTSLKFAAISVLLLCFSPNVFAQHIDDIQSVTVLKDKNSVNITPVDISRCDILDTALLTVAYRMYARASEGSEPKYIDDIILLIGRRYTQSFPGMYDRIDSLFSVKKLSLGAPMVTDMEVLRDIQSDSISVYNRLPAMGDLSLSYSECLPRFDWRITQQTEEICGYPCYTATTNFRGTGMAGAICPGASLRFWALQIFRPARPDPLCGNRRRGLFVHMRFDQHKRHQTYCFQISELQNNGTGKSPQQNSFFLPDSVNLHRRYTAQIEYFLCRK